jgi:hypothetical protein
VQPEPSDELDRVSPLTAADIDGHTLRRQPGRAQYVEQRVGTSRTRGACC